jgi:hypothetical protein
MKMKRTLIFAVAMAALAFSTASCFAVEPGGALNSMGGLNASPSNALPIMAVAGVLLVMGIMHSVSYTNPTGNFQHVGAVTIPPYETRDVDETLLPGYVAPAEAETAASKADDSPDLLAELLGSSVRVITEELPGLSDEDLARVATIEEAGANRKGVHEALAAETLRRAQADA